jgi:nicotinate-nucleotide--dimethylbenzimidazole phosphoribosyltransferase
VGAGALPVDEHRRRPPIQIVPVDARARDAALARGAGEVGAWLAAVTGSADSPRVGVVSTGEVEVLRATLAPRAGRSVMTVGEVALAVDTGRALAARAAADGVDVLVTTVPGDGSDGAARALAAGLAAPSEHGPLGALRRLGDPPIAVLCGVALGAGEHGLGCVAAGAPALAGAAVADGIEPDVRPRLIKGAIAPEHALVDRLGLASVPGADAGAVAAALGATPLAPAPPPDSPPAPR